LGLTEEKYRQPDTCTGQHPDTLPMQPFSEFEKLFHILKNQSQHIYKSTLRALLSAINAHPDLIAFEKINNNLLHILPLLPKILPQGWQEEEINQWLSLCQLIEQAKPSIQKDYEKFSYQRAGGGNPLHGFIGIYPLYSALWSSPPTPETSDAYFHLQAHFINAYSCFMQLTETQNKNYQSVIRETSLALRVMHQNALFEELLLLLPERPTELKEFTKLTGDLLHKYGVSTEINTRLIPLHRMLDFAFKKRGGNSKERRKSPYQRVAKQVSKKTIAIESDIEGQKTIQTAIIEASDITKNEATESIHHGCDADESFSGATYAAEKKPSKYKKIGETPETGFLQLHKKFRYFATLNQNLHHRWERLNIHDVLQLIQWILKLSQGNAENMALTEENQIQLACLVATMYWTASPVERASQTILLKSIRNLPGTVTYGYVYLCLEEKAWAMPLIQHDNCRHAEPKWKADLEPIDKKILLPVSNLCLEIMQPWLSKRRNFLKKKKGEPLFTIDTALLEVLLKKFTHQVNKQHFTRLTPLRIASHIDQVLADRCKDSAEAMITFAKLPPTGQKTSLYYYAPRLNQLQEQYVQLCNSIENHINYLTGRPISPTTLPEEITQRQRTGSELCPRTEKVKRLSENLRDAVKRSLANRFSFSLIDFHNTYTTYCVMMLGYASGYRAVRDPFYSIEEVDRKTGFTVISDKDDNFYHNSRIIWLPPLCLEQINAYNRHRHSLKDRLVLLNPALAEHLSSSAKTVYWRKKKKDAQDFKLPFFFFLKRKWEPEPVTPSTLQKNLDADYTLPLNVNRHFLRTHLRESGVHGEIVDAFMGHWGHGQAPFGRYSTLAPTAFRDALAKPLNYLLEKCGWTVLKGLE
jgi:hypothetical protein